MKTCLSLAALTAVAAALAGCAGGTADPNQTSFSDIRSNPTPELVTLTERQVDVDRNVSMTFNQNRRMLAEDWGRFWLTDRPSRLSPAAITPTGGKPR